MPAHQHGGFERKGRFQRVRYFLYKHFLITATLAIVINLKYASKQQHVLLSTEEV
jgi:hypothetical protein